jgi:citrate lyase gamma subunit
MTDVTVTGGTTDLTVISSDSENLELSVVVDSGAINVTLAAFQGVAGGGGGVTDGDKGDVVVSSSGTVWLLDSAITADIADGVIAFSWGDHASAGYLESGDIGTTVQGYDADTAKLDVAQSWTAQQTFKELKDTVHTITDGAAFEIDPANGSIQTVTLGANRTPAAANFEAGQIVLLGIDDGTAFTITWTTVAVTWVKAGGTASAPTLATTGFTWVLLWKVGSTIYGVEVGKP